MNSRIVLRPVPLALCLALSGFTSHGVLAQDNTEACNRLDSLIQKAGQLPDKFSDAPDVVTSNDPSECGGYVDRMTAAGVVGKDQSSDSTTETMDLEEDATIDGKVKVTLPDPEIDVQQDPAEVSVKNKAPDITVNQGQPTVTIKQAKPIIRVEMPQPTITVEQPAPEITITMPDPSVDVANAQPTVDVNIPEPRVTVRQSEPKLNVDLALQDDAAGGGESNSSIDRSDENGTMTVKAEGLTSASNEPNIQFTDSDKQAKVSVKGAEPNVDYQPAEPDVKLIQGKEKPNIEIVDSGEPKVMINKADGKQNPAGSADQQDGANANQLVGETRQAALKESESVSAQAPAEADEQDIKVGELNGMSVVNEKDKELGTVDRVVKNGSDNFVIISHGGWLLGLNGKEVAMPLKNTFLKDGKVLLRGLTEKQVESLPDYSYDNEISLNNSDSVSVMATN